MTKGKSYTIEKYAALSTTVRIGQVWYVQIEPIMAGNPVVKRRIVDVTAKTVELENVEGFHKMKTRYKHYSVSFVEIVNGD